MPKTYNGFIIPPLEKDITEIQGAHCDNTKRCADHCDDCLFYYENLESFTEWFNKKKYYGK